MFEGPGADPDGDAAFVRAVGEAGNVVLGSDLVETDDRAYDLAQWVEPFPELGAAAAAVAAARVTPDPDGVVRRVTLATRGAWASVQPGRTSRASRCRRISGAPRLVGYNGAPRQGIRTVSYYQALDADTLLPRGTFEGKVVFVGRALSIVPADRDVPDHYPTPVGLRTPGVEIHASLFDTIARGREVRDPAGDPRSLISALLVVALAGGFAFRALSPGVGLVTVVVAGMALLVSAWWAFTWTPALRLPVIAPVLTLVDDATRRRRPTATPSAHASGAPSAGRSSTTSLPPSSICCFATRPA